MTSRTFVRASSVEPEAKRWLWTGRIPLGGITLIEGNSGDGKTALTHSLAALITTGRPMPITGDVVGPAGVVLLQAEDLLAETVRPALETAGADLDRIMLFDKREFVEQPLLLPDDVPLLEEAIDAVSAKAVVIDPLPGFLAGSSNSEQCVRRAFGQLAALAETKRVAIIVIRHLTKDTQANPKCRGGGSVSIIGAARSALMVADAPDCDDPFEHVLVLSKSNLATAPPLRYRTVMDQGVIKVEWLGNCSHSSHELLAASHDCFESSQLEEACYVLYTCLADARDGKAAKEVLKEASNALVSIRTLKRAKKRLGVRSHRRQADSVTSEAVWEWVWKLPTNSAALRPYEQRALREQVSDVSDEPQKVTVLSDPVADTHRAKANSGPEESALDANGESFGPPVFRSWDGPDEALEPEGAPTEARPDRSWDE